VAFDSLGKISCESMRMLKCANKLSKWVSNTFMSITFIYIIYVTILTLSSACSFTEIIFNCHYNDLKSTNVEVANWLKCILKKKWAQAFDKGWHWGHMTTNLIEFINSVLKGTHYLPIITIVKETCRKVAIFFTKRRMEAHAMITFGQEFGELVYKCLDDTVVKICHSSCSILRSPK